MVTLTEVFITHSANFHTYKSLEKFSLPLQFYHLIQNSTESFSPPFLQPIRHQLALIPGIHNYFIQDEETGCAPIGGCFHGNAIAKMTSLFSNIGPQRHLHPSALTGSVCWCNPVASGSSSCPTSPQQLFNSPPHLSPAVGGQQADALRGRFPGPL